MDKLPHIVLPSQPEVRPYTSTSSAINPIEVTARNRVQHGSYLQAQFKKAWHESQATQLALVGARNGVYLEFISDPGAELVTKSLEDMRSREIRLLNIRKVENDAGQLVTLATVYVSNKMRKYFASKFDEYINQNTDKGNPKHQRLVASIADIKSALLVDSFWTDLSATKPGLEKKWVEVWLRGSSDEEVRIFDRLIHQLNLDARQGVIKFPERIVKVIFASMSDLEKLTQTSDLIAEYRLAKTTSAFFMEMSAKEQSQWVTDLLNRIDKPEHSVSSVCILDTGVNNGHPLLRPHLADEDCQSIDPNWGVNDRDQHGTLMAGTALYGDLTLLLENNDTVPIRYALESVKILPHDGENKPELWGYIIAQGVSRAEIQAPERKRTYCMAVTATDTRDRGRPSSWSAEIDQLTARWNEQRLFIISAGNSVHGIDFTKAAQDYPAIQVTESAHDPAQSWNALTVGAITNLVDITDPKLDSYSPVAQAQTLSPFSTTSSTWEENKWPIKPELVLEGGNLAIDRTGFATECDDLSILSITHQPHSQGYFYPFNMTSAATAQLARMAGALRAEYPSYWEETIRALLVHSADWPEPLKNQFTSSNKKADLKVLLSICGYGVPDLNRALFSAKNSLTLISQAEIQPFDRRKKPKTGMCTRDMHFYDLPWPKEVLQALPDNVQVKMKVTLSYFIEPGPGEIGWKDRYRYASHALRFDINNPSESKEEFVKRINKAAREEDEQLVNTQSASGYWFLGSNARDRGSIHSDTWIGTSAELATSHFISVMPKIGWWRERAHLGCWNRKTRYSLIVSIETVTADVDIYTPVVTMLGLPIPVAIQV
ncbi:Subtilisin-like serine protease [Hahella chejuensis KCTC 2396]|uniref:Subtilisin-like serine protease n=1 Tax=Hahella chejuensis (strain KCTC 2396) TaxID=349521 RepID=Q2SGR2_HAHCH|nr:S8 family peptidase [Hahella chejuensis]ABC30162.1 Subtilisin-like serine protease [Hahella chejuensis KCTC 2396]